MKNLDEIYEYINNENFKTILIINNNSKILFNTFYESIYDKYLSSKMICKSGKGLMKKLSIIRNKFIRIDLSLNKIQFSSSTNQKRFDEDFETLKLYIIDNNLKIMFKTNDSISIDNLSYIQKWNFQIKYDKFDMIILLDKNDIKILKDKYWNIRNNNTINDHNVYSFLKLSRRVKLKQLKNKSNIYES